MTPTQPDGESQVIHEMILKEFLPGEDPRNLTQDTALITNSILDSLAILKLVSLLEERFKIRIEPHETDVEHLNTIAQIAALVRTKQSGAKA